MADADTFPWLMTKAEFDKYYLMLMTAAIKQLTIHHSDYLRCMSSQTPANQNSGSFAESSAELGSGNSDLPYMATGPRPLMTNPPSARLPLEYTSEDQGILRADLDLRLTPARFNYSVTPMSGGRGLGLGGRARERGGMSQLPWSPSETDRCWVLV